VNSDSIFLPNEQLCRQSSPYKAVSIRSIVMTFADLLMRELLTANN
jgi:hypothetical protein